MRHALGILVGVGAACAAPTLAMAHTAPPPARVVLAQATSTEQMPTSDVAIAPTLALETALQRVATQSPTLQASQFGARAANARARQAALPPNPELGVDVENFNGDGPYRDSLSRESTIGLTQTLELGGDRRGRAAEARGARDLAYAEVQLTAAELRRDVIVSYARFAAAQETLAIAEDQAKLAREVMEVVRRRNEQGLEADVQLERARIVASEAAGQRAAAERDLATARTELGAFWGDPTVIEQPDMAWFRALGEAAAAVPSYGASATELVAARARVAQAEGAVRRERAGAVPDVTVSLGTRRFEADGSDALVFGASVPLQLFNRNRNGIASARADLGRARAEARATELGLSVNIARASADLENARSRARLLTEDTLPAANRLFLLSRRGYEAGALPWLDFADARKVLAQSRTELVAALVDLHAARAELERLLPKAD